MGEAKARSDDCSEDFSHVNGLLNGIGASRDLRFFLLSFDSAFNRMLLLAIACKVGKIIEREQVDNQMNRHYNQTIQQILYPDNNSILLRHNQKISIHIKISENPYKEKLHPCHLK